MNILINTHRNHWMLLCGMLLLVAMASCNPKKDKSEITGFEEKPITPAARAQQPPKDTASHAITQTEKVPEEDVPSYTKPPAKNCQPNFTLIGKPKSNRYLYYVTGFNPSEFKCWAELEAHGVLICKGEPCTIYYLDSPKATMNSTPPHYIDPKILLEHGLGQFEYTNHWWEMKGAKLWGRSGNAFAYFNTNNNAGG
jgi:hypothetical protein